jgi:hypothetical protein
MEIRKKRGFPQELGKAFGFPTVPTGPTRVFFIISDSKRQARIHLKGDHFLS